MLWNRTISDRHRYRLTPSTSLSMWTSQNMYANWISHMTLLWETMQHELHRFIKTNDVPDGNTQAFKNLLTGFTGLLLCLRYFKCLLVSEDEQI